MAKRRTKTPDRSLFDASAAASAGPAGPPDHGNGQAIALHEAAEDRYLNYALSVITSRALPDVRDGLKPVQRRILYTMWQQRLTADAKHRKCAKVVGDVMGSYHPHGDAAIYDALVRMAQPFAMRVPLVDGSGNFGSLDGDPAAAMRYTECRLQPVAAELLDQIAQDTVHFRPNYDGTKSEPVVLPARLPNLLLNGSTGIAVGMASNIPPHNLRELCTALVKLLDNPELKTHHLCRYVKGPDFPTGGQILNTPDELKEIYRTGAGPVKVRATYETGPVTRSAKTLYINSIPYAVNKATLVERIAEVVLSRKMPLLLDVRDLSTDDVRIALELKKDADEQKVLAYLFKHTPLQTNFNVNLTCLVPTENPEVGRPERSDLREILWNFLLFRMRVVTRRLEHELKALNARIHILEGFEAVFDALDQIIKIIRASDGKPDAAKKIMARFKLDADQTDAILELKLYRLAKLEILVIRKELEDKRKRARQITRLLKSEDARWKVVRDELARLNDAYGKQQKRRTLIEAVQDEPQFSEDDFIVAEDSTVVVTRDGWVKRQREVKDIANTRLREGDAVLAAFVGSTRATAVFFSNLGTAYTARIADLPPTTGYGEPIQKLFKLKDGERLVAAFSLDPRTPEIIHGLAEPPPPDDLLVNERKRGRAKRSADALTHALTATSDGYTLRFSLNGFLEPSTRAGRRFGRVAAGAEFVGVHVIDGTETVIAASQAGRAILCAADEVSFLSGPGRGVKLMRLDKDDRLLGFIASTGDRDLLTVKTSRGGTQNISTAKYETTSRGGKGRPIIKRGTLTDVVLAATPTPEPLPED